MIILIQYLEVLLRRHLSVQDQEFEQLFQSKVLAEVFLFGLSSDELYDLLDLLGLELLNVSFEGLE